MEEKTTSIWMNGKLIPWDDAKIHILTHTLHYGSGAFEGMRFYKTKEGSAIFRLREHVGRLFKSFSVFKTIIPFSNIQIEQAIIQTVKDNLEDCKGQGYIRPIVFHGHSGYSTMGLDPTKSPVNIAIVVWPWGTLFGEKPVKVKISPYIRLHPKSVKVDAKICGYYVNSILASLEAKESGFDEAVLLDYKGNVAEGPGENIFIVKNKKILTPPLGNILPGITRDSIITIARDLGYTVEEKNLSVEELLDADEVFFSGTAAEVHPIAQVNDKIISKGKPGKITEKIKNTFLDIVKGKNEKYKEWLAYV